MDMATDKKEVRPVLKKDVLKGDISKKDVAKKEKAKPAPNKKSKKFDLKKTAVGIGHFFRDVVSELKKVTWASRKEFMSYSLAVVVFVAVFGSIIFVMDTVLGRGVISNIINLIGT
jgi:preprotein translocase SecE subunit